MIFFFYVGCYVRVQVGVWGLWMRGNKDFVCVRGRGVGWMFGLRL